MRRALLLLPLLFAFLTPLGVAGAPADPGPLVVTGPMLTPPDPAVYDALPFVLQPDPQPVAVSRAGTTEEVISILVDFNDAPGTAPGSPTAADIETLLFDASEPSLNASYQENSYGATQVVGDSTDVWYRSNRPNMAWYGGDNGGIDNVNVPIYCLAVEAVRLADGDVDFSRYDNDLDGEVDHLVVVHAGDGQETSPTNPNLIWSHHWVVINPANCPGESSGSLITNDGVRVREYLLAAETSPLGVFVHEFGHDFGLPDLYDTTGATQGIGAWGVMGMGSWNGNPSGSVPAHFTAWSKAQLGWLDLRVVTDALAPASIPALATSPVAYKLPIKDSFRGEEYFIVENRQRVGFDGALPGAGLLVWHVDETVSNNANSNRRLVDLEEADEGRGTFFADNPSQPTDAWADDSLGFTPDTVPGSDDNDGARTGWKVTGISPAQATMQANISIGVIVDLAVLEVTRPSFVPLNEPVQVDVLVISRGLMTVSNGTLALDVFYQTYNVSAKVAEASRSLPALSEGESQSLSFNFTPAQRGTYLVEAFAQVPGDELPENNVRIVHVVAGQHLLLEDVEGVTPGWTTSADTGSAHRWEIVADGDGFGTAHSPTRAMRFGDFGVAGAPVIYPFYNLTSPETSLGAEVPRLLYYQRYELAIAAEESGAQPPESDVASVSVSFDGGDWIEVASFTGTRADWAPVYVDLAAYAGGADRLRLRFTVTAGRMPQEGGWWIDDVAVVRVPLGPMPLLRALGTEAEVSPGSSVSLSVLVVNVGDLPANFTFSVQGLPPDWGTLIGRNETSAIPVSSYEERLGPDQQRALNLIVRAPLLAQRGVLHAGTLTAVAAGEGTISSFAFTLSVPLGFGFNLSDRAFTLALVIGGVMLALAMVLTALRRRRRPYPPY